MDGLSVFALIILSILIISAIVVFIVFARMPGEIAKKRNHPQADAVAVGGWLGLLFGGVLWPFVMVWAFLVHPDQRSKHASETSSNPARGSEQ
ncbi:MAG: DUF3302 domain-containing protein [Stappiaceae bacterium]